MDNQFIENLKDKIENYKKRYPNKNKIPILKLIFFLFNSLFQKRSAKKYIEETIVDKIAFLVHGGLGDHLIAANYIYIFLKKINIKSNEIHIYSDRTYAKFIFNALTKNIFNGTSPHERFSLLISLTRFPNILSLNIEKSYHKGNSKLLNWIQNQIIFKDMYPKYFFSSECDGESALFCVNKGKKRINQPDITNEFNLTDEYLYQGIPTNKNILAKYNLEKNKYITIHRGVDSIMTKDSNKLWPQSHYNELIPKLKNIFPDHKIIQLGLSHARCEPMMNIDINLVEKTNLADIAALLKNSFLHIDCEGGLVHLRHALNGGVSVVFFGPTAPEFFGYSENINIRNNCCPNPCEWMSKKWQEICIRDTQKHICMTSIMPDEVIKTILNKITL